LLFVFFFSPSSVEAYLHEWTLFFCHKYSQPVSPLYFRSLDWFFFFFVYKLIDWWTDSMYRWWMFTGFCFLSVCISPIPICRNLSSRVDIIFLS
jgi:hypothetical protein